MTAVISLRTRGMIVSSFEEPEVFQKILIFLSIIRLFGKSHQWHVKWSQSHFELFSPLLYC